jgi:gamma-glutamylcyclotransferase (GGCT)/AIG2-like uncharacterized protein YtfP
MDSANIPLTADVLLFAYGSLMRGERHHSELATATFLGMAKTQARYRLVDLGLYPAMIDSPDMQIEGELFSIPRKLLIRLDGVKEIGRLFHRLTIPLESGAAAETYMMEENQVRGRRRLHVPSWGARFSRAASRGPIARR